MEPDPDVLEMVRRQLDRDPPPSTEALYGRAASINSDIYELTLRQFNATYVLRVKRERKRAEKGGKGGGSADDASRGSGKRAASERSADPDEEAGEMGPRPGGFLDALREEQSDDGDEERPEQASGEAAESGGEAPTAEASGPGGSAARGDERPGRADPPAGAPDRTTLRERIREVLWRYGRRVVAGTGMVGAVAAVETVDDHVQAILELAGAGIGDSSSD